MTSRNTIQNPASEPFKPTLARNMLIVAAIFSVVAIASLIVAVRRFDAYLATIEAKEARAK